MENTHDPTFSIDLAVAFRRCCIVFANNSPSPPFIATIHRHPTTTITTTITTSPIITIPSLLSHHATILVSTTYILSSLIHAFPQTRPHINAHTRVQPPLIHTHIHIHSHTVSFS